MSQAEFVVALIGIFLFFGDITLLLRQGLLILPQAVVVSATVATVRIVIVRVRVLVGARVGCRSAMVSYGAVSSCLIVLSLIGAEIVLGAFMRGPCIVMRMFMVVLFILKLSLKVFMVLFTLPFLLLVVQIALIVFPITLIFLKSVSMALMVLSVRHFFELLLALMFPSFVGASMGHVFFFVLTTIVSMVVSFADLLFGFGL